MLILQSQRIRGNETQECRKTQQLTFITRVFPWFEKGLIVALASPGFMRP